MPYLIVYIACPHIFTGMFMHVLATDIYENGSQIKPLDQV